MNKKNKRTWTTQEDQFIMDFVKQNGTKSWVTTSIILKQRSYKRKPSECRDRWFNHLDPNIKKKEWTLEQQKLLFKSLEKYGSRWCQISKLLPGRTQNAIKNQFYSILRSCIKILAKNFRPQLFSNIRQMSPLDLFNLYMKEGQRQSNSNIIKQMLFSLDFQIYKQTILRFMENKEQRLKQFFDNIESNYQKKDNHNNYRESTTNLLSNSEEDSNKNQLMEQQVSKYFMVNVYIPVFINKEKILKVGYGSSLVNILNRQLETLDINYFLQKQ